MKLFMVFTEKRVNFILFHCLHAIRTSDVIMNVNKQNVDIKCLTCKALERQKQNVSTNHYENMPIYYTENFTTKNENF